MRRLSQEEREIWERLGQTVRPLRKRARTAPAEAPKAPKAEAAPLRVAKASASPQPPAPRSAPKAPVAPSLTRIDEKTRRRLSRGAVDVDARIDLHGMRQQRAHDALLGFLTRAQAEGARVVLVVTGKGAADDSLSDERRGILRQSVPGWLTAPDMRGLVAGFEPAARRHGGEGALYVRVRRRRAARAPAH